MSSVSLNVGQSVAVTPVPLRMGRTVTPGASLLNVRLLSSDPRVATVMQLADGRFVLRGVAPGKVSLSGWAFVRDPDGAGEISGSATVAVSDAPHPPPPPTPAAESVSLGFEFWTPV